MVNVEPLPLLEAHFFLASRQTGFSVSRCFSEISLVELPDSINPDECIGILTELEARLGASIEVDETDLAKLYRDIGGSATPYFPSDFFAANMLTHGLKGFAYEDCFERMRSSKEHIPGDVAQRILGEAAEESMSAIEAVEIIGSSNLSNENKLLLIDVVLHPDDYISLLERALVPVAREFSRCGKLIAPLLRLYRHTYDGVDGIEAENAKFGSLIEQGERGIMRYEVYPLITYFHLQVIEFSDTTKENVFIGEGVLYRHIMKRSNPKSDISSKLSSIMSILGNKSRFDIVAKLSKGPQYGRELADYLELTPATVSHHINALISANLIKLDMRGKKVYYSLNYEQLGAFAKALQELFTEPKSPNALKA